MGSPSWQGLEPGGSVPPADIGKGRKGRLLWEVSAGTTGSVPRARAPAAPSSPVVLVFVRYSTRCGVSKTPVVSNAGRRYLQCGGEGEAHLGVERARAAVSRLQGPGATEQYGTPRSHHCVLFPGSSGAGTSMDPDSRTLTSVPVTVALSGLHGACVGDKQREPA